MNTPDPPHWTLNAFIGAFCSVWVHFGWFHYFRKLGAKRAELVQLMQKFVSRSRIGILRLVVFGALDNVLLQHKTRCKKG